MVVALHSLVPLNAIIIEKSRFQGRVASCDHGNVGVRSIALNVEVACRLSPPSR